MKIARDSMIPNVVLRAARESLTASVWAAIRELGDESVSAWLELNPSGLVPWGRIAEWTPEQIQATAAAMSAWIFDVRCESHSQSASDDLELMLDALTWEDLSFRHWMALEIAVWTLENSPDYRRDDTKDLTSMIGLFREGVEHGFDANRIAEVLELDKKNSAISSTASSMPTRLASEMATPIARSCQAPTNTYMVFISLAMSAPEPSTDARASMLSERLASRTLEMLESIARVRSKELSLAVSTGAQGES